MRSFAANVRLCVLILAGFALVIVISGCWTRRTASPGPNTISGKIPELKSASKYLSPEFELFRWREGLNLLIVDGLGFHVRTGMRYFYNCEGAAEGSKEYGPGYEWRLDTADGETATFRFDDKEYDLSEGALFVIKAKNDKVEVHQLNRDLSTIPFDSAAVSEYLKNDVEVRKILGVKDEAK